MNHFRISVLLGVLFLLSACLSGYSPDEQHSVQIELPEFVNLQSLCLNENRNLSCENEALIEKSTIDDTYSMPVNLEEQGDLYVMAKATDAKGEMTLTSLPLKNNPKQKTIVITPLTTMIRQKMASGDSFREAVDTIRHALDISKEHEYLMFENLRTYSIDSDVLEKDLRLEDSFNKLKNASYISGEILRYLGRGLAQETRKTLMTSEDKSFAFDFLIDKTNASLNQAYYSEKNMDPMALKSIAYRLKANIEKDDKLYDRAMNYGEFVIKKAGNPILTYKKDEMGNLHLSWTIVSGMSANQWEIVQGHKNGKRLCQSDTTSIDQFQATCVIQAKDVPDVDTTLMVLTALQSRDDKKPNGDPINPEWNTGNALSVSASSRAAQATGLSSKRPGIATIDRWRFPNGKLDTSNGGVLSWLKPTGIVAETWTLFQDGKDIYTATIGSGSTWEGCWENGKPNCMESTQIAETTITADSGKRVYQVQLCASAGLSEPACSVSEEITVEITGTGSDKPDVPGDKPEPPVDGGDDGTGDGSTPPPEAKPGEKPAAPSMSYIEGIWKGGFYPDETFILGAVKWWGVSGDRFKFFENGKQIGSDIMVTKGDVSTEQRASIEHDVSAEGSYTYTAKLCNDSGCTEASNQQVVKISNDFNDNPVVPPEGCDPDVPGDCDTGGCDPDVPGDCDDNGGGIKPPPGDGQLTSAEYLRIEQDILAQDKYKIAIASIARAELEVIKDTETDEQIASRPNVQRVISIFEELGKACLAEGKDNCLATFADDGERAWNYLFPNRNTLTSKGDIYSYKGYLRAVAHYKQFCGGDAYINKTDTWLDDDNWTEDQVCKNEMASMFAHMTQEVGAHAAEGSIGVCVMSGTDDVKGTTSTCASDEWRQGLYHIVEMNCSNEGPGCEYRTSCDPTQWPGQAWACPADKKYFGRGAKQLSYNYNYAKFSRAIYGDSSILVNNPEYVAERPGVPFLSAFWFFMQPQSPKPSMHDALTGYWTPSAKDISLGRELGFGMSTMIINGGLECGGSTPIAQDRNRSKYYKGYATAFGIWDKVSHQKQNCDNMQLFDDSSSGAFPSYWEQDWSQEGACQLVTYEAGPYSMFHEGDYEMCVLDKFFNGASPKT